MKNWEMLPNDQGPRPHKNPGLLRRPDYSGNGDDKYCFAVLTYYDSNCEVNPRFYSIFRILEF